MSDAQAGAKADASSFDAKKAASAPSPVATTNPALAAAKDGPKPEDPSATASGTEKSPGGAAPASASQPTVKAQSQAAAQAAALAAQQQHYRPLTVPEKLNWVDEILVGQLNELPQPQPSDSAEERKEKLRKVIQSLVPEHRPFYNMYQFHQYVGRGLWSWGYHVRLDRADQFLHCYPVNPGVKVEPFSILFRFQPYSHNLPKERRHVYVVHIYRDDMGQASRLAAASAAAGPAASSSPGDGTEKLSARTPPSSTDAATAMSSTRKLPLSSPAATKTTPTRRMPLSSVQREWNKMYDRLVAYKEKTGHTKVPARYKDDRQLGRW